MPGFRATRAKLRAMAGLYGEDLAYVHAAGFGGLARGAAPEIIRQLRSAQTSIRHVIDAGCGAGPLTAALIDAGFSVTGIDVSGELLAMARVAAPRAGFIEGSIYEAPIADCDAVVALGEPLTYHEERGDADRRVAEFFRTAAAALPRSGMLIFDIIETGEPALDGRFWTSTEDWAVLAETKESGRELVRTIETFRRVGDLYRRSTEVHHVSLFDSGELTEVLARSGFSVETARSYGSHPLGPRRRAFFCTKI